MSFEPGGDPRIPNQMPLPNQSSEARPAAQRRPEDLGRAVLPVALVNGAVLVAAVLVVYVFELVDPALGIWIIVALAAVTSMYMVATIRRFQRSVATSSTPGQRGTEDGSVDAHGRTAAPAGTLASPTAHAAGGQGLRFEVEEVFSITGRGTVVTGAVAAGTVTAGQPVLITRGTERVRHATVSSVELFRRMVDVATVGDKAGLLLPEVTRSEVSGGDVIVDAPAPGGGTRQD